MKNVIYIWMLVVLVSNSSYSQDMHLSQIESSPMVLNPALTGNFHGDHRFGIHQRSQWASVIHNPFISSALNYDRNKGRMGYGGYVLNNRAGSGSYNALNAMASGSYSFIIPGNPEHKVWTGIQAGVIQKTLNISKLTFEDQYNGSGVGGFGQSTGESVGIVRALLPDLNFGILYHNIQSDKQFNYFVGTSVYHLLKPKETFMGAENRLLARMITHAGIKINANRKFQFLLHGLRMWQGNVTQYLFTWQGYYYFDSEDIQVIYGITRRTNNDALIAQLGLNYNRFVYRLSYDVNTSGLRSISNGRGGIELSVIYTVTKFKPPPIPTCPDL